MTRLWIAALLALAWTGAVHAQSDPTICRNGDFPTSVTSPDLNKVTGDGRLYFQNDTGGCPNETAACRQRAYVVAGNEVLTGQTKGAYTCAFFPNRFGGSAGWVPHARLTPISVAAAPTLGVWAGHWANGDDTIDLKAKGAALSADGEAYWPSKNPSAKDAPGGPNEGQLSGLATPAGQSVVFADKDPDGCKATLTLVGDLLVVADNNMCGGMNVSFSGVYVKK